MFIAISLVIFLAGSVYAATPIISSSYVKSGFCSPDTFLVSLEQVFNSHVSLAEGAMEILLDQKFLVLNNLKILKLDLKEFLGMQYILIRQIQIMKLCAVEKELV